MRIVSLTLAILVALSVQDGANCQQLEAGVPASAPEAKSEAAKPDGEKKEAGKEEAKKADPFDFSGANKSTDTVQRYLVLDENIKVKVDPIERSPVVDRVTERTTITVKAPGSVRVEIFLEPVDSPFCGRSLGEPRLIGRSTDGRRNFPVIWSKVEPHRYVKVYAKAYKPDGISFGRSRSVDLAMAGSRFQSQSTAR
jgi:hypothetical protein